MYCLNRPSGQLNRIFALTSRDVDPAPARLYTSALDRPDDTWYSPGQMSGHHHFHPYMLQDAAFFVALIPSVLLLAMVIGAQFFDGFTVPANRSLIAA